ncbi:MAG: hypothetical protein HC840_32815 [Leptolyngbyaceae cyanobacterium RM2_2_4]|nr:hypothetical protein [Leptolyngbyaceae cyanobacterium RM2_2_4]
MSKNDDKSRAQVIFRKWRDLLASRDRTFDNVYDNFADLWYDMYKASVSHETAYTFLDEASAVHLPTREQIKRTYTYKKSALYKSEKEFMDSWIAGIKAKATEAFYEYYPLEEHIEMDKPVEKQPAGGLTRTQLRQQRQYLEQFPILTFDEAKAKYQEIENDFSQEKLDKLMKELLDDEDK